MTAVDPEFSTCNKGGIRAAEVNDQPCNFTSFPKSPYRDTGQYMFLHGNITDP